MAFCFLITRLCASFRVDFERNFSLGFMVGMIGMWAKRWMQFTQMNPFRIYDGYSTHIGRQRTHSLSLTESSQDVVDSFPYDRIDLKSHDQPWIEVTHSQTSSFQSNCIQCLRYLQCLHSHSHSPLNSRWRHLLTGVRPNDIIYVFEWRYQQQHCALFSYRLRISVKANEKKRRGKMAQHQQQQQQQPQQHSETAETAAPPAASDKEENDAKYLPSTCTNSCLTNKHFQWLLFWFYNM